MRKKDKRAQFKLIADCRGEKQKTTIDGSYSVGAASGCEHSAAGNAEVRSQETAVISTHEQRTRSREQSGRHECGVQKERQ